MFRSVVQWVGVTTALPVVGLLVAAVAMTMRTYHFTRLVLMLRRIVRSALSDMLTNPSGFDRRALDSTRRAVAALGIEPGDAELKQLDSEYAAIGELTSALLAPIHGADWLATGEAGRSAQFDRARDNLTRKVDKHPPTTIVRRRTVWICAEVGRVVVEAFRDVGAKTTGVLIRRAGQHMTSGSVVGLVLGILVWFFESQYRGDFYDYIGGGVTLGAFIGLACTAVTVVRDAATIGPEGTGGRGFVLTLVGLGGLMVAFQWLAYLDPSWWPVTPPR